MRINEWLTSKYSVAAVPAFLSGLDFSSIILLICGDNGSRPG